MSGRVVVNGTLKPRKPKYTAMINIVQATTLIFISLCGGNQNVTKTRKTMAESIYIVNIINWIRFRAKL
jgi:hypothetical protein